ncbi:acyl-CoA dehydrogenase family protein [Aquabacterium sp. OR-4]|uniref:acyl-CoA dehydrogenase family protein n=1 Tax=Aquabacterium sp. OR-4 TaxID=2978127 RepID=UPI0028C5E395|nr:acyl-CoA dehydrogenase family protein [Aquabacterium sp. OR-4]MDT7838548.1 acyl-CoA dehydrogenase family protein [Aquabacterium sp. OR-4]
MDFDFSSEQRELQAQARRYLADHCGRSQVRAVLDGPQAFDATLWQGLGRQGYLGAAIPEAYGGLLDPAAPADGLLAQCVLSEELGRAVAPVPYASSLGLAAPLLLAAGTEAQKQRWLPALASGELIATLAWAEGAGRLDAAQVRGCRVSDGRLHGSKQPVADGDIAHLLIVAARCAADEAAGGRAFSLWLVQAGPEVQRQPLASLDPTRSQAHLVFNAAPAEALGAPGQGAALLDAALDRAAVPLAFEQIGGADAALEAAVAYAQQRYAFGRPIGSLQAIKHMLADMYVSATLARSNACYGAWALASAAAELPEAAATARVSATQAYQHCARNNIQAHGGMGFTWEFDCHLHYRRAQHLALALGSARQWEDRLVDALKARRTRERAAGTADATAAATAAANAAATPA